MNNFYSMCTSFAITNPFPVFEQTLCRFAAFLADEGMASQMIATYLSALQNTQISMGLLDPRDHSSFPVLRRVQAGRNRV